MTRLTVDVIAVSFEGMSSVNVQVLVMDPAGNLVELFQPHPR